MSSTGSREETRMSRFAGEAFRTMAPMISGRRSLSEIAPDLFDEPSRRGALEPGDVVLILQQHAERIVDRLGIEGEGVEFDQRPHPVERLGNARRLEKLHAPQRLDEADHLPRQ